MAVMPENFMPYVLNHNSKNSKNCVFEREEGREERETETEGRRERERDPVCSFSRAKAEAVNSIYLHVVAGIQLLGPSPAASWRLY